MRPEKSVNFLRVFVMSSAPGLPVLACFSVKSP